MGKFIAAILIFVVTILFIIYVPKLLAGISSGGKGSFLFNPFNFNPIPNKASSSQPVKSYYYTPPKPTPKPYSASSASGSGQPSFSNYPQPQTFILTPSGNSIETDQTNLTITFSGSDPKGKNVYFETELLPNEQSWQMIYGDSRTINFQEGGKTYTFLVRAKTADGRYDTTPAKLTIISTLSPYYNKIFLGGVAAGISIPYFSIYNNSQKDVDVTGFRLQGTVGSATISQGVRDLTPAPLNFPSDIALKPGEQVIVSSGPGPSNINFLENKCTGYFQTQNPGTFPSLSLSCPLPDYSDYSYLSPGCINYIQGLGSCQTPNLPNVLYSDIYCSNYVYSTFNYNSCYQKNRYQPYFFSTTWRVFSASGPSMFRSTHDTLALYDQNNQVVARYSY